MRTFETYTDRKGVDPVNEYLAGLSLKDATKILRILTGLSSIERLGSPYLKLFSGYPFWFGELIIGNYRIFVHRLGGEAGEERYLLLHAFRKKTQQTPPRELDQAIRNLHDHYAQEREESGGA